MTIEAWIKPESGDEFARLQTIAMLGDLGWGVQLMCPEGAGLGCCGDHVMRSVGFFAQEHPLPSDACERTLSSTVGVALDEWSHIAIVVDPEGHTTPIPPPPPPPSSPSSPLSPSSPPLFPPPSPVPCQRQIVVTRTDADWWGKDLKFNCASGDGSRNITVNVGASAYASTHVYPVGEIVPDDCPVAVDKDNCAPHCDLFTPRVLTSLRGTPRSASPWANVCASLRLYARSSRHRPRIGWGFQWNSGSAISLGRRPPFPVRR